MGKINVPKKEVSIDLAAGAGEVLDNIDLLREVVSDSERRLG